MLIDGDKVVLAHERRDCSEICQGHRWKNDARLGAQPFGEFFFGNRVRTDAGKRPRCATVGAPLVDAAVEGFDDSRVAIEPEKAVGAEVDDAPAQNYDLASGTDRFKIEMLQVGIGHCGREMFDESADTSLLQ